MQAKEFLNEDKTMKKTTTEILTKLWHYENQ